MSGVGSAAQRLEQGTHNPLVLVSNPSAPNLLMSNAAELADDLTPPTLSYATPVRRRVGAGALLWFGFGALVLGGALMAGVMAAGMEATRNVLPGYSAGVGFVLFSVAMFAFGCL